MAEVEVRTVYTRNDGMNEGIEIYVDGNKVAKGRFGGEPEDATRFRDYSWVDDAIEAVAKALGAEVEFTDATETEDDD